MSGTAELRAEAERLTRRLKAAPSLFAGDMEAMVDRLNAALVAAEEGSTASPAKPDTKAGGAGDDPLDKVAQALTSACAAFIDMAERFRQRNARDWAARAEQEQAKCEAALATLHATGAEGDALRWLEVQNCDLRCIDVPTGCGDADVDWIVIEHYMEPPREREIGRGRTPMEAVADARARMAAGREGRPDA